MPLSTHKKNEVIYLSLPRQMKVSNIDFILLIALKFVFFKRRYISKIIKLKILADKYHCSKIK